MRSGRNSGVSMMQTDLIELLAFVVLIAIAILLSYRALRIRRSKDDR
jgi:hypothetical protein